MTSELLGIIGDVLGVDPAQAALQQLKSDAAAWQAQVQAAGLNVNLNLGAVGQRAGSSAVNAVIAQATQAGNAATAAGQSATSAYNAALQQQAQQGATGYAAAPTYVPSGSAAQRGVMGDFLGIVTEIIGDYTALPALAQAAQTAGQAALSAASAGQALPVGSDATAWLTQTTAAINAANQAASAATTAAAQVPPPSPISMQPPPYGGGGGFGGGGFGGGGGGDSGGGGGGSGGGDPGDPGNVDWGDGPPADGGGGGGAPIGPDQGDQADGVDWGVNPWASSSDAGDVPDSGDGADGGGDGGSDDNQEDVMGGSRYLRGVDVLVGAGAPVGTPANVQRWHLTRGEARRQRGIMGDDVRTIPTVGANYTDAKTVLAVQSRLKDKGYDPGALDGIMGSHTKSAIKKMQSAAGLRQSGIIDEGVIMALGVTPGVLPPGVTAQGRAAVQAQVALDAATLAEHSVTPQEVQAAAAQVADAAPAEPPELVQAVQSARAAAQAAATPAQIAAARQQVQDVALQVHAAVAPGWWSTPVWSGAPVKRWQGAVGVGAGAAVVTALGLMWRRH